MKKLIALVFVLLAAGIVTATAAFAAGTVLFTGGLLPVPA